MSPEERMYCPYGLAQLDYLFERVISGKAAESTINIRRRTLDYALENASYADDNFGENTGLVRIYLEEVGMVIIYSTIPTEECSELFPVRKVYIDSSENTYTYVPYATSVENY